MGEAHWSRYAVSKSSQNVDAREAKLQLESGPIVTKLLLSSKLTAKSKSTPWELVYVNSSQIMQWASPVSRRAAGLPAARL